MAEASREREKSAQKLWYLSPIYEWSECSCEDSYNAYAELQGIPELDMEDGLGA
jgi:hypothetical protein